MKKVIKSFHQPTGEERRFPSGVNLPAGEPNPEGMSLSFLLTNSFIVFLLAPLLVLSYTF